MLIIASVSLWDEDSRVLSWWNCFHASLISYREACLCISEADLINQLRVPPPTRMFLVSPHHQRNPNEA